MPDIAITGMGCRFPGGVTTPDSYWTLLTNGVDAIVDVPADRWNSERYYDPDPAMPGKMYIRQGGFLSESIFEFDAAFFGITPREAERMDPQQRLLLKVVWEALEDARSRPTDGLIPRTGVFIGAFTMDNMGQQLSIHNRDTIMGHTGVSTTMTMLANRISHAFDLHGPSISVDTACSSSLVALHLACQSLLNHECDMAIVGGVNLMFRPEFAIAMCKGRYLSPDARCKTFDERANGYARGEGAGVVILKRAEDAHDSHVYAMIAGTGVNQDGHTPGISVPDGDAQTSLMREVYQRAGISPRDIQYVEAHGTGTAVGDPIEMASLGAVLSLGRGLEERCWVGSVKTNIGHLEAAAGVASIIKAVLCLQHQAIPPHLHLKTVNPHIDLDALRLRIPLQTELLAVSDQPLYVAVNAFGYGGTNAHAILRDVRQGPQPASRPMQAPHLFVLSARDDEPLHALARRHADHLAAHPDISLLNYGYTSARLRPHHDYRLAIAAGSLDDLRQRLSAAAEQEKSAFVVEGRTLANRPHKLAYVYSGMGIQSWGMAADMLTNEIFRTSIARFDAVFCPLAGWSIFDAFKTDNPRPMTEPQHAQPANLAVQMALTEVWSSYGLRPDGIMGHSVGEIAAAWAAGSLTFEAAVRLIYHRSQLQQRLVKQGMMVAVGMTEVDARAFIADRADRVSIAAVNSAQSVVLAGDADLMPVLAAQLMEQNIFNRFLQVDVAYHSHQMSAIKEDFYRAAADITAQTPQIALYSSVSGMQMRGAEQTVDYWWRNNAQAVLFQAAVEAMRDDGYDTFLEIGPHPALAAHIRAILGETDGIAVSSLHRQQASAETLLTALGQLYTFGHDIAWDVLYPAGQRVPLPRYAWRQDVLWTETAASNMDRVGPFLHPILQTSLAAPEPVWMAELTPYLLPYLYDHRIGQAAIFPAAGYIEMMLAHVQDRTHAITLEDVQFHKMLVLAPTSLARLVLDPIEKSLTVFGADRSDITRWSRHATAKILTEAHTTPRPDLPALAALRASATVGISSEQMYQQFARHDLNYGPLFQAVREMYRFEGCVLARVKVSDEALVSIGDYWLHPALLDGCFQSLLGMMQRDDDYGTYLPTRIRQVRWYRPVGGEVWSVGRLSRQDNAVLVGDLVLYTPEGEIAAEIIGFECQVIDQKRRESLINRWFYELAWELTDDSATDVIAPIHWLLLGTQPRIADPLMAQLSAAGHRLTPVHAYDAASMPALIQQSAADPIQGVIYLAGDAAISDDYAPDYEAGMTHANTLLALIQALTEHGIDRLERMALITCGAYQADANEPLHGFGQMGMIGLGRVIANEHPLLNPLLIDLSAQPDIVLIPMLIEAILSKGTETELMLRANGRSVRRLAAVPPASDDFAATTTAEPCVLRISEAGTLDNLYFDQTERVAPGDDEIEIRVHASALNFKDLMKALGLLPQRYLSQTFFGSELGLECAGEVVRVGKNVTRFKVGDPVVAAEGQGCFRSYSTISTHFVVHKPPTLSFAESVNFINFLTAYYSLIHVARLQPGERVLIHAAAGGVGLAAVQVAQWAGAHIFATAGSQAKRDMLTSLGINYVSDSRSLRFEDDILNWTHGEGVDVVLNSLPDEFLECSLNLLASFGRFIEIGKRDIIQNKHLAMAVFDRNLTFSAVDIDIIGLKRPALLTALMQEIQQLFADGHFKAIPTTVYPAGEVIEAFRHMSQARHIGKIAIDMLDQPIQMRRHVGSQSLLSAEATYLITGGFSGFGLATAEWMVEQGARHLVLASRRGAQTDEAQQALARMHQQGAEIAEAQLDVANRDQVAVLIDRIERNMPPLRGIIHSAMVLDDTFLTTLTEERFKTVVEPKVMGAWHLHRATQDIALDFFVLYSSISAIIGNPRQANYVAANAMLDGLAHLRRSQGLPASSINWGSIRDVGVVARNPQVEQYLEQMGIIGLDVALATRALERVLREDMTQIVVVDMNWERWAASSMVGTTAPLYSHFLGAQNPQSSERAQSFYTALHALTEDERKSWMQTYLIERISQITRLPVARLGPDDQFDALGLDSLMTIEFNNAIKLETGQEFSTMHLLQGPTVRQLAVMLLDMMGL